MVLVTYPRAPARISPITSSAASETDSARNFTCGWVRRIASSTARPPPSGMCTSSSTTSGSVAAIRGDRLGHRARLATTSTWAPSSARTPARNIAWSSTRNTRSRSPGPPLGRSCRLSPVLDPSARVAPVIGMDQPYLGALARLGADLRLAAVPLHPPDDRAADAVPVLLHRSPGRSPTPRSRTNTLTCSGSTSA